MPDAATPDLATSDLTESGDLATPDLATPDLTTPDLATPDLALPDLAKPDLARSDLTPGGSAIIEEFVDGGALDPDGSTVTLDPTNGGALIAPVAFDPTTGCDGGFAFPDGGGTLELDGGVYSVGALNVPAGSVLHSKDPLDIRVCGDVTLAGAISGDSTVRLTTYGNLFVGTGGGSGISGSSTYVAVARKGSSLTMRGDNPSIFAPGSNAHTGAGTTVLVNGDLTLDGHCAIFSDSIDAPGHSDPVRVVVAGNAVLKGHSGIFSDEGNVSNTASPVFVRIRGDLTQSDTSAIFSSPNGGVPYSPPLVVDITVGGRIAQSDRASLFNECPSCILRVRARGDIVASGGGIFLDSDDGGPGGTGAIVDVLSLGTFTTSASLAAGDSALTRRAGTPGGSLAVRAQKIDLAAGASVAGGGAGAGGAPGDLSFEAAGGGYHLDAAATMTPGPSTCVAGSALVVKSNAGIVGDFVSAADAAHGLNAGASLDGTGCTARKGGDVALTAGGAVQAGTVTPGAGKPAGMLSSMANVGTTVTLPAIALVETYTALSRVYDLGAPSRVRAVSTRNRPDPVEGTVGAVQIQMADAPSGPFGPFTSDLAQLGTHRYLRWRVTVDAFFFDTAGLDRLEIDYVTP